MTSIIKFTPLCGALEQPLCYLLEIDELRILLDCGWNDSYDVNLLKPLARIASRVNYVLLSHADIEHVGALPYAGMNAKILCTIPVQKMGTITMYDAYQSRRSYEDFDLFTLDDVDQAFDTMVTLKYSQRYQISENGIQLEITAQAAGHSLGGTIWRIKSDTDDIVYAVDYNHQKERHLNPSVLESLSRPTLLITDSLNSLNIQLPRKQRDTKLFEYINTTLSTKGGNVLLPCDSASRVLELMIVLDQHWQFCRLSNVGRNTLEFAKSTLEWMSDAISKNFFTTRENAFSLAKVNVCHSLEELQEFDGPKLVIATMGSLLGGFAQELFIEWAGDANNAVIFVDRSYPNTPARRLMENPKMGNIYLEHSKRIPLVGLELLEWERQRKLEKEQELARREAEEERKRKMRQMVEIYDYDGEDKDVTSNLTSLWQGNDLYVKSLPPNTTTFPMFPFIEKRSAFDAYGEVIRPEDLASAAEHALASEMESNVGRSEKNDEEMDVEGEKIIPTKCIKETLKVSIQCSIQYIDFEGRSDGRSIKKILSHVQPRKLILVHGGAESTANLTAHCRNMADAPKSVMAPQVGETVDVTEGTNLFRMQLKHSFIQSLRFINIPESQYAITYVDGIIMVPPKELTSDGKLYQPEPYLDTLPITSAGRMSRASRGGARGHDAIFVGDVKLSNFRQILNESGLRAEFNKSNVLVVNGTVALWRDTESENNNINIDGALSEEYFKVRQLLYSQFHLL